LLALSLIDFQAAERILVQAGGVNMNTWVVGNVPIGHGRFKYSGKVSSAPGVRELGEKVFFMKARIMAGQANLADNQFGLKDFRWLTKDEVPQFVTKRYWDAVQNMLPER
jgi:large subunit ribosomal protein L46